jgi:dTDP-4-dehydrorhamnose 3,5-epimerase
MVFKETPLKGSFEIVPEKREDERGFFFRSWCAQEMSNKGLNTNIKQINCSFSLHKGTLRGLTYQRNPFPETKLIRCVKGSIFDVIIDLREGSPTLHQWFGTVLSAKNSKMLYIPENFAHGFITLEDKTEINYFVTEFYHPEVESGIRWNDPYFGIQWPIEPTIISEKDKNKTLFKVQS